MNNQMAFLDHIDLEDFKASVERTTRAEEYPGAVRIDRNIPIYDGDTVDDSLIPEWTRLFETGPGVLVIKRAIRDLDAIDAASAVFQQIIEDEKAAGIAASDHFAKAGANDRIWNSHQKLCLRAPEVFLRYMTNPVIDTLYRSWLGPGYQMAAQVNQVRPSGKSQSPHRDYHLGFMTDAQLRQYPEPVHRHSHLFLMQGGVAHIDVPVDAGPTKLLPFSQVYPQGYAAAALPEFRDYFEQNYVQLPLEKGDCVFFSPALFHAAGENRTSDVVRMVNLLQASSPMVRAMESLDRAAMSRAVFPYLKGMDEEMLRLAIAATAEGYPFPTNLDSDPAIGGLAPESQQGLLLRAVREDWSAAQLDQELDAQLERRKA
ncbi:phytanoyl-CoA dioxygenase family protein [Primorskyibacter flagellatus]|uniref:Ectoine hydroxylase-related dioxygenase, phytanoyl-CoA dioxygenase (PhyH) family n=1 Tax=Primorskyibacter flagellatus TaxID=1387277 RepID=A0A1W2E9W9_9RHOB|nr:phytanoyl-CoA dioxygenase family protein [Primorskyibacter flagellatus]SMD06531.1 Ectoine hydroxylase-related dioxygenase, phytanoyl-CoA dioxygenase (PhyH) family [Primorskyibacter flagellatus]